MISLPQKSNSQSDFNNSNNIPNIYNSYQIEGFAESNFGQIENYEFDYDIEQNENNNFNYNISYYPFGEENNDFY